MTEHGKLRDDPSTMANMNGNYQIKLTPGGFPDLLGDDPVSPRTVADLSSHHSVIDLADASSRGKYKGPDRQVLVGLQLCPRMLTMSLFSADLGNKDDDDTLLDDILDDDEDGADEEASDDGASEYYSEERYRKPSSRHQVQKHLSHPVLGKKSTPSASRTSSNNRDAYYYNDKDEKKEDDRMATLRDEFDRQAFASVEHTFVEEHLDPEDEGSVYGSDEESEEEDDDDESVRSGDSATTVDLLERAHDRLHMQQLHDEIDNLKSIVERKNVELENLTGQLRRAVATKCDLVSTTRVGEQRQRAANL